MPSVEAMTVRVLFFSTLRDLVGKAELPMELPAQSTVGDLLEQLEKEYSELKQWKEKLLIAVNHEYAEPTQLIKEGSEVAIMPPVQGG